MFNDTGEPLVEAALQVLTVTLDNEPGSGSMSVDGTTGSNTAMDHVPEVGDVSHLLVIYSLFTRHLVVIYSSFTRHLLIIYSLFTRYLLVIYSSFTHHLLTIYSLFTRLKLVIN